MYGRSGAGVFGSWRTFRKVCETTARSGGAIRTGTRTRARRRRSHSWYDQDAVNAASTKDSLIAYGVGTSKVRPTELVAVLTFSAKRAQGRKRAMSQRSDSVWRSIWLLRRFQLGRDTLKPIDALRQIP